MRFINFRGFLLNKLGPATIFLIPTIYLSVRARNFEFEDALIYYRYIRNALEGHGLVYNTGSFVNALTSPLHASLLLVTSYLTHNIHLAAVFISSLFMGLALVVFVEVFSVYCGRRFAVLAAALLACSPYLYSTFGIETTTFIFLIGLCLYCFEKNNVYALGIACALLLLARAEGIFLILAMIIEHLRQRRPIPKPAAFVLPLLILCANSAFNMLYYKALMPHSSSAKIYHGMSGEWGYWPTSFLRVQSHFPGYFDSEYVLLFGLMGLALCGFLSLRLKSLNMINALFLFFLTCFYVFLNIPNYHWYYAPYYVFACFYAGAGASWLVRYFHTTGNRWVNVGGRVAVFAFVIFMISRNFIMTNIKNGTYDRRADYYEIAIWVKENTPMTAQLAALEIGTLGWYSERPIVDLCGLVSPSIAKLYKTRDYAGFYSHHSPEYVLVHDPMPPMEAGITEWVERGDYVLEKRFDFSPGWKYNLYVRNDFRPHLEP
jgi:hypothetical protein